MALFETRDFTNQRRIQGGGGGGGGGRFEGGCTLLITSAEAERFFTHEKNQNLL